MNRIVLATLLFAGLSVSPTIMKAQDHDHHDGGHPAAKVYYDKVHKDKHEWNDGEAASWDRYRQDHHVTVTLFDKTNKRQQQAYWNWRHDHPDAH